MPTSLRKPSNKAQEEALEELKKDNYKKRVRRKLGVAETLATAKKITISDSAGSFDNSYNGVYTKANSSDNYVNASGRVILNGIVYATEADAAANNAVSSNQAAIPLNYDPNQYGAYSHSNGDNLSLFWEDSVLATAKTITVPQFTDSEGITRGAFYMELEQLAEGNPDAVILVVFDAGQPDEQVQRITAQMINDGWGSENINDAEDDFDTVEFRFPADSGVWEVEAGYIVKGDNSDRPLLNAVMDGTSAARLPVA